MKPRLEFRVALRIHFDWHDITPVDVHTDSEFAILNWLEEVLSIGLTPEVNPLFFGPQQIRVRCAEFYD